MKHAWMVALLLIVGCASIKQAKSDYDLGKSAPLAENEVSARDAAKNLVEPVAPFIPAPFQPVAGVAISLLTAVGLWQRGRKLRKQLPVSSNPITGEWGQKIGLEKVVQTIADVTRGIEIGPENSGVRRGLKVLILGIGALATTAVTLPSVQHLLTQNPQVFATILAVLSVFTGIEKELSKVLPVTSAP